MAEKKDTASNGAAEKKEAATNGGAAAAAKSGGGNAWFSRSATGAPPPGISSKTTTSPTTTSTPTPGTPNSTRRATASAQVAATSLARTALLRERFLSLTLGLIGHTVTLRQTDGTVLEGVLHTFTPFASGGKSKGGGGGKSKQGERNNVYVIRAARIVEGEAKFEAGSTVVVPSSKVAYVLAKSVPNSALGADESGAGGVGAGVGAAGAGGGAGFRTDTDISRTGTGKERDLVAAGSDWTAAPTTGAGGALEAGGGGGAFTGAGPVAMAARQGAVRPATNSRADALGGRTSKSAPTSGNAPNLSGLSEKDTIGKWDQFAANETLFNVKATYDENLYTTALDKSGVSAQKQREAARLAKEIEGQTTNNIHLAEERGQKLQGDYEDLDEEDKYSGVLTSGGKVRAALAKVKVSEDGGDAANKDKEAGKEKKGAGAPPPAAKAKMSWAAAAGAGKGPAAAPPQAAAPPAKKEEGEKKKETPAPAAKADEKPKKKEAPKEKEEAAKKDEAKGDATDKKEGDEEPKKAASKPLSKLSATAKEFTFNPGAKTFTPGGGMGGGAPAGGAMGAGGPPMPMPGQPVYMQHPQGEIYYILCFDWIYRLVFRTLPSRDMYLFHELGFIFHSLPNYITPFTHQELPWATHNTPWPWAGTQEPPCPTVVPCRRCRSTCRCPAAPEARPRLLLSTVVRRLSPTKPHRHPKASNRRQINKPTATRRTTIANRPNKTATSRTAMRLSSSNNRRRNRSNHNSHSSSLERPPIRTVQRRSLTECRSRWPDIRPKW